MARTKVNGGQLTDNSIGRNHLNTTTTGTALLRKISSGLGTDMVSTGVDAGTGDVTLNVTNPLFKTTVSLSTYAGAETVSYTIDGRNWQLATASDNNSNLANSTRLDFASGLYLIVTTAFASFGANAGTVIAASATLGANKYWVYNPVDGVIQARHFGGPTNFNGGTDDSPAVQAAINWCRKLYSNLGGTYQYTIKLPSTQCKFLTTIDCTNATGLLISGSGGPGFNTNILGNTGNGNPFFDFTGSSLCGISNMMLRVEAGYTTACSTVGVLFALGQDGSANATNGLDNFIKDVYFQFEDLSNSSTLHGGLGHIGIVSIQSEEFYAENLLIRTNTPVILTNKANISDTGYSYTFTSQFATIRTATGSEGVHTFAGCKLQAIQARTPVFIGNGTNDISFTGGYLTRFQQDTGTNEIAFLFTQYTAAHLIQTTIERCSTALRVPTELINSDLNFTMAFQRAGSITKAPIDLTNASLFRGNTVKLNWGNAADLTYSNYLISHDLVTPNGGVAGDAPCSCYIQSCQIVAPQWPDNRRAITGNLVRNMSNTEVNTTQSFYKQGNYTLTKFDNYKAFGTIGSLTGTQAYFGFSVADRVTYQSGNGGIYRLKGRGEVNVLGGSTIYTASMGFQYSVIIIQNTDGTRVIGTPTLLLEETLTGNSGAVNITSLAVTVDFVSGYGRVLINPTVTGTDTTATISIVGGFDVSAIFGVNGSLPFAL